MFTSCHFVLPTDGNGAPDWVQLVPAGTFSGADGRGPYKVADATAVIAASLPDGGRLPVDENHSTDLAAPNGQPSPAKGWIVEMQARDGSIWGRVEWTESGRALMADKSYRGISPVFETDKSGRVLRLLRAALTNAPNLTQLATLQHQGPSMNVEKLRAMLGLGADVDEAAIITAVETAVAERTAHATRAAGLEKQLQVAVAPNVVAELQAQLNTLREATARDKAVAFVDGAIKSGKPVVALRDHYIARHMQDAAAVEKEIGALVSINAGGLGGQPLRHDAEDGDGLTEMEAAVCRKMGLDRKEYAKQCRQARGGGA